MHKHMTSNGAKEYELCICMLILFQYLLLLVAFDTLDHKIHLQILNVFFCFCSSIWQIPSISVNSTAGLLASSLTHTLHMITMGFLRIQFCLPSTISNIISQSGGHHHNLLIQLAEFSLDAGNGVASLRN